MTKIRFWQNVLPGDVYYYLDKKNPDKTYVYTVIAVCCHKTYILSNEPHKSTYMYIEDDMFWTSSFIRFRL